ncbi:MAG: hypothetical protein FJX75_19215, partial [Armatimonadetes bacterium]|nr:hypothetical protein [Armatimonadota bacterium]
MQRTSRVLCLALGLALAAPLGYAASPEELAGQQAMLKSMEIQPAQLKPLRLETPVVTDGRPVAVICHADDPAWRTAATVVQQAIADVTSVTVPLVTDHQLPPEDFLKQPVILLGHLDNNRHVARLYHSGFVCLDQGFTGRTGYEIRSVHNPFGAGHNAILVGGSFPEGTQRAAEAFAELVRERGQRGSLVLGRLLDLQFDPQDRLERETKPTSPQTVQDEIARYRKLFASPGEGGSAAHATARYGLQFHRTGDPGAGEVYRGLMAALLEYYRTDAVINQDGMARYDNDFRDSWTFTVAKAWDLCEESGLFTDQERLDYTNLIVRLGLECVLYQGYNRPAALAKWRANTDIVHNHNTFPALGVLFVGEYMKRHYGSPWADDWLAVAHGIFNGLKHTSKPLEDAAGYEWLPIVHCAIYSLSEGDMTFLSDGHLREAAQHALQVMDNAGNEAAYGDHSEEFGSSGIGGVLQLAAWYYRDPQFAWGVRRAASAVSHPLQQGYHVPLEPAEPAGQVGLLVSALPRPNYDMCASNPSYPTPPNVPYEQTFNKLSLRAGWDRADDYLLLDGFGRGNHMHFDANAIIRYTRGGVPLLCDGEYIKNGPKYHSSMVIIRDGQAELAPAVTRLDRAERLPATACCQTTLTQYNGADWTRTLIWRPNGYLLVADEVTALQAGDYTLRCCWRPWGESTVVDGSLRTLSPPMRLEVQNLSGEAARLEELRKSGSYPVSRFSEQIGLSLKPGDAHRFLNLVVAGEARGWQDVEARQVKPGVVVIERGGRTELVCLGEANVAGLQFAGQALVLSPDGISMFGATRLTAGNVSIVASTPVALEVSPERGTGLLIGPQDATVTVTIGAGAPVTLTQAAGTHRLTVPASPMPPELLEAIAQAQALPPMPLASMRADAPTAPPPAWELPAFAPQPSVLPIAEATADPAPIATRGPVGKLFDGAAGDSLTSAMWPAGKTATITITLADETEVRSVALREWHMNAGWAIGSRKLELSSDGFRNDVRSAPGDFVETGTQSWGSNVNTIYEQTVGQRARQLRLTLVPANEQATVYLAEIEVHGIRPGAVTAITALAAGDLNGDGKREIVIGSEFGQCRAIDATGNALWEYTAKERARINSLGCADVNGDGRDEVMVGQNASTLGLLGSDGKLLWTVNPPRYRFVDSDVMCVFPGDVNGDDRPEVVCGTRSWQFFAHDAAGKTLWRHVIYAHAATVGCAADLDSDGKQEVVAGNVYYTLNVIDHDGARLWRSGNIGPEMTAVAAADITGDGKPEVFAGVDDGTLYAFDAGGKRLWQVNLGDKVTRLLPVDVNADRVPELVCAAESAHVFAIGGDGKILWRAGLPDGCTDMALGESIVACCGGAGLAIIARNGTVRAMQALPARPGQLLLVADQAVVSQDDGRVFAVRL